MYNFVIAINNYLSHLEKLFGTKKKIEFVGNLNLSGRLMGTDSPTVCLYLPAQLEVEDSQTFYFLVSTV